MKWKHITISQYQSLLPSAIKGRNDVEKMMYSLSICYKLTMDKVRAIPLKKARKMNEGIKFLEVANSEGYIRKSFFCRFKRYRVTTNAKKLSFDQYMTAMELLKDINEKPEVVEKNLHLLIANICRPMYTKKFDLIKMSNDFKDRLTMDIAYPIISTFLISLEKLNTDYKKLFEYRGGNETSKSFSKWGWIITLDNLSNSDASKWNYYKNLNVIEGLNICMYYKSKSDEMERIDRLEKLKNKR
jgi:hypothetical protein